MTTVTVCLLKTSMQWAFTQRDRQRQIMVTPRWRCCVKRRGRTRYLHVNRWRWRRKPHIPDYKGAKWRLDELMNDTGGRFGMMASSLQLRNSPGERSPDQMKWAGRRAAAGIPSQKCCAARSMRDRSEASEVKIRRKMLARICISPLACRSARWTAGFPSARAGNQEKAAEKGIIRNMISALKACRMRSRRWRVKQICVS